MQRLLLAREPALEAFWQHTGLEVLTLADVLGRVQALQQVPVALLKK